MSPRSVTAWVGAGTLWLACAAIPIPAAAQAPLPVDVTVPAGLLSALQRLGCTPIQACVDAVAEGLGGAVRALGMAQGAGPSGWASREVARSIGQQVAGQPLPWSSIFRSVPPNVRGPQLAQWLRGSQTYMTEVQGALTRSQLLELNTLAAEAQNAAQAARAGTAAVEATEEATWRGSLRAISEGAQARFGEALMMDFTSVAARLTAAGLIAGTAGAATYAVLQEYRGQMESLGNAKEAESYNNDVRLLLGAIRTGRQQLAPGLTLGDALVRLRANRDGGRLHFEGIFRRAVVADPPPGQPWFVYYDVTQVTCCKEGNVPAPHPIRVGPVPQWLPSLRRLAGPFDSRSAAVQWICEGRAVYSHYHARAWARFGDTILTEVPCPITAR